MGMPLRQSPLFLTPNSHQTSQNPPHFSRHFSQGRILGKRDMAAAVHADYACISQPFN